MGNYFGSGYGFGGFGFLFMFLFWGLIVWGIVAAVKMTTRNGGQSSQGTSEDTAVKLLRERYAKGEITKEQFEEMKKNLVK